MCRFIVPICGDIRQLTQHHQVAAKKDIEIDTLDVIWSSHQYFYM